MAKGDISERPWSSITEADYESAEEFCRASLINQNESRDPAEWAKSRCKLPIYEPRSMGGRLNRNAVFAAAAALAGARGGVDATPEEKRRAARALVRIYRNVLEMEPPESLKRLAEG